jgi:hypothetical protein
MGIFNRIKSLDGFGRAVLALTCKTLAVVGIACKVESMSSSKFDMSSWMGRKELGWCNGCKKPIPTRQEYW